jgi:hypothetical protein
MGFCAVLVFLGILTVGFVYEWQKGALDWSYSGTVESRSSAQGFLLKAVASPVTPKVFRRRWSRGDEAFVTVDLGDAPGLVMEEGFRCLLDFLEDSLDFFWARRFR